MEILGNFLSVALTFAPIFAGIFLYGHFTGLLADIFERYLNEFHASAEALLKISPNPSEALLEDVEELYEMAFDPRTPRGVLAVFTDIARGDASMPQARQLDLNKRERRLYNTMVQAFIMMMCCRDPITSIRILWQFRKMKKPEPANLLTKIGNIILGARAAATAP